MSRLQTFLRLSLILVAIFESILVVSAWVSPSSHVRLCAGQARKKATSGVRKSTVVMGASAGGFNDAEDGNVMEEENSGSDAIEAYRRMLERSYHRHNNDDDILYFHDVEASVSLLSDADEDEVLHAGGWLDGCGEDCEQCEIPEEMKACDEQVDVLAFLGIGRAKPIRVEQRVEIRDWE